ncbi:MAG: hypothetical protein N2114_06470 [Candidatus Goldbacteria bacterium]|nr:hypothetical protein [Candidatus Goldiibacteriota bacterium]
MDSDEKSEMYRKLAIRVCRRIIKVIERGYYYDVGGLTCYEIKSCGNDGIMLIDDVYIPIKDLNLRELKEVLDWIFKKMSDRNGQ